MIHLWVGMYGRLIDNYQYPVFPPFGIAWLGFLNRTSIPPLVFGIHFWTKTVITCNVIEHVNMHVFTMSCE